MNIIQRYGEAKKSAVCIMTLSHSASIYLSLSLSLSPPTLCHSSMLSLAFMVAHLLSALSYSIADGKLTETETDGEHRVVAWIA